MKIAWQQTVAQEQSHATAVPIAMCLEIVVVILSMYVHDVSETWVLWQCFNCCYILYQYTVTLFTCINIIYYIAPRTCAELGFVDRCCEDRMSLGFCEIESSSCSCKQSCFIEKNCCPEIGCSRMWQYIINSNALLTVARWYCAMFPHVATNCAQAGLDAGCCTGSCNVTYGTNGSETCFCDERCRINGDCCEDVNQTKQCRVPSCTLTISKSTLSCTKHCMIMHAY